MKNKIQVAFLLSRILVDGGITRVTAMLTQQFANDERFHIHVISYQPIQKGGYHWDSNLSYYELVGEGVKMKRGIFKATSKLRKILTQQNITTLISCGQEIGPLGALSTLGKSTKFVYWSHSSFKGKTHSKFKILNELFTTTFADVIISLTKVDKINYKKGTLAKKVVQIYNPVDPTLLEQTHNYNPSLNKIISVGRLSFQKNFLLLIDVAKKVIISNPNIQWDIYGDGYQRDELKNKIHEYGLEQHVILKGHATNIYEIYKNYSLMVMTSRFEGFPMSLIEGLATKLPLISFDIPTGPNEIIEEGVNGFLIEPENVDAMAYKIEELLSDQNKLNSFSKAAFKSSEAFSMKTIYDKWVSLFISLAK
ncbi:glycosyltransferase family 4 protein [Maribacter sedimenticola]|nr:glycosyltransferase family 4 protein [Maribacter sedimenticola]